jgi:hypothetical protein
VRRLGVVFAVLGALCAGCGTVAEPPDAVSDAAAKTVSSLSWRFEVAMTTRGPVGADPFEWHAHGVQDVATHRTRTVFEGRPEDLQVDEIVTIDKTTYIHYTPDARGDDGKAWTKYDDDEETDELYGVGLGNPTTVLGLLRDTSRSIERLGVEPVRGVRTTRSRAIVDVAKLERRELGSDFPVADGGNDETMPVDVWIDDDGRVRRLAYTDTWHGRDGDASSESRVEFFDFGVDVDVQPPPAEGVSAELFPQRTCDASRAGPISVDDVLAALRRHDFDVVAEQRSPMCVGPVAGSVTNAPWMDPQSATDDGGDVRCYVWARGDGERRYYVVDTVGGERPVTHEVENVACTLSMFDGVGDAESRFRVAMKELGA